MHAGRGRLVVTLTVLAFALACGASSSSDQREGKAAAKKDAESKAKADSKMTRMTPNAAPGEFVAGPTVGLAAELLAWFKEHAMSNGKRQRFRVPVVVAFEDKYRLDLGEAFVGGSPDVAKDERLRLDLDDGALGIALLDTVQSRCGEGQMTCSLWLEGYWGPLVEIPELPSPPGAWPFAVLRVGDPIAVGDDIRVMVAKSAE